MISIIIPTYNGANLLKKYSIPSLLLQTYKDWEAIIINDGSNDDTTEVVNAFISKDKRIKLIENKDNLGLAASLNNGVKKSSGDIIMILEHDDIWLPEKLEKQVNSINLNNAKVCTCSAIVYSTKDKKFTKINGGNLSCLSFKKDNSDILFPLPEENKKFLGIEDGIISARLNIAKESNVINQSNIIHLEDILTIMNSDSNTLSGVKDSISMAKRYKNIINFYTNTEKDYHGISHLMKFWKKHYLYNKTISLLPLLLKKLVYYGVNKIKRLKSDKQIKAYKKIKQKEYENLLKYRESFN